MILKQLVIFKNIVKCKAPRCGCRDISYSEEFIQLPYVKVQEILKRDSLVIQTEDAIFDCVMRWVRHDPDARRQRLQHLVMSCVHMALLDERYVREQVGKMIKLFSLLRTTNINRSFLSLAKSVLQLQRESTSALANLKPCRRDAILKSLGELSDRTKTELRSKKLFGPGLFDEETLQVVLERTVQDTQY